MRSMTGFGRSEKSFKSYQLNLEIKSVNHRFLDLRFRLPAMASGLETELSDHIRKFCERGSLDISLREKTASGKNATLNKTRFFLDKPALESLMDCVQKAEKITRQNLPLTVQNLIESGKIFVPMEQSEEDLIPLKDLLPLFTSALKDLQKMREAEGKALEKVLQGAIIEMKEALGAIKQLAPIQAEKLREKLESRLAQWNLSSPVEPRRLEWEIAVLAEKSDITEEIDRLEGHFEAFTQCLGSASSVGRKLDFLTQELNREVNTIASKTTLIEITQLTVRLKSNIEKLREQVQNVE